jgi:hypothetical protein
VSFYTAYFLAITLGSLFFFKLNETLKEEFEDTQGAITEK